VDSVIRFGAANKITGVNAGGPSAMTSSEHVYEVRPRKDHRGYDLISDVPPFGRLWYGEPNAVTNAIGYAKFFSRSHDAVIRVYDRAGNVIETHKQASDFRQFWQPTARGQELNGD
jgi:hypothetical protein